MENYLKSKKCFKLILGAGNKNYDEITKLTMLYSKAGCRFFDVNASMEAILAAKKGIELANVKDKCFICVSIATKNDPHLIKCKINPKKCISCALCKNVCPQKAINDFKIDENKCIGCTKCNEICPKDAIEKYSTKISFSKVLPPLIKEGIDCIEYHVIENNNREVMKGLKTITNLFKGILSVCLDRSKLGNYELIKRLKIMKNSCNNIFIIQADGAPMSGGSDDYRTTLQAVATADIIEKAKITPYIMISGGTNSKTTELIKLCNIPICGVAFGSWARKMVREYIEAEDFFENKEIFNQALKKAKELVDKTGEINV